MTGIRSIYLTAYFWDERVNFKIEVKGLRQHGQIVDVLDHYSIHEKQN